jgi:hypothetical protein
MKFQAALVLLASSLVSSVWAEASDFGYDSAGLHEAREAGLEGEDYDLSARAAGEGEVEIESEGSRYVLARDPGDDEFESEGSPYLFARDPGHNDLESEDYSHLLARAYYSGYLAARDAESDDYPHLYQRAYLAAREAHAQLEDYLRILERAVPAGKGKPAPKPPATTAGKPEGKSAGKPAGADKGGDKPKPGPSDGGKSGGPPVPAGKDASKLHVWRRLDTRPTEYDNRSGASHDGLNQLMKDTGGRHVDLVIGNPTKGYREYGLMFQGPDWLTKANGDGAAVEAYGDKYEKETGEKLTYVGQVKDGRRTLDSILKFGKQRHDLCSNAKAG